MIGRDFVLRVLAVEAGLFVFALALFFGHGAMQRLRLRRGSGALERARAALARVAGGEAVGEADADALSRLPRRLQVRAFTELLPHIAGADRARLDALAGRIGMVARAERLCGSPLWWRRLRGVRLLQALGHGGELVPRLLRDRHPAVREEAIAWAADHPEPGVVAALVSLLAEPGDAARFTLRDTLLRLGRPVVEPLASFLETHGGAAARAALEVAAGIPDPRFAPAALRLCGDPLAATRARAATLAAALGGDRAVDALRGLLADPEPAVRAAAVSGLARLGHWPAAAPISRLLRDPAWDVRREAGLALRALGSPGLLLLRRALDDPDPFAADMARQVLDLPGGPGPRARP